MIAGKAVIIEYDKYDRYGRIVGKILLDGEDINLGQVKAGMAWHYKKYQNEQSHSDLMQYAGIELEARNNMRGLWYEPEPIPPWDYRRGTRGYIKSVAHSVKSGHTCGTKRYCRQMTSCKEAMYYLNKCGLSRLDGDGDGVPCENMCKRR